MLGSVITVEAREKRETEKQWKTQNNKGVISFVLLICRLLAELNSPLYIPDPISADRKHILEDMERKYREFITATLRCLSDLKRELCEWNECVTLTCPANDFNGIARHFGEWSLLAFLLNLRT